MLTYIALKLGSFESSSPLIDADPDKAFSNVELVISTILGIATTIAGLVFLTMFILAAYNMMTSGGDASKFATARNRIIQAIVGLLVIVAAYAVVGVIGGLLGLNILNLEGQLENLERGPVQGPQQQEPGVPIPTFDRDEERISIPECLYGARCYNQPPADGNYYPCEHSTGQIFYCPN